MMNDWLTLSSPQPFAVLILAAGYSTRLGQPKQLLKKDGKFLLHYFIEIALNMRPQRITLVINESLKKFITPRDFPLLEIVINLNAAEGLASSLQKGAEQLNNYQQPTLIMGIDQPLISVSHLQQLWQNAQRYPSEPIVSSYANTIGIPVMLPASIFRRCKKLSGEQGLKQILLQYRNSMIQIAAPHLAFDIDTPEDLWLAQQHGWIDSF